MAENDTNEHVNDDIPKLGDEVLRAYDIIPSGNNQQKEVEKVDVPGFDLGDQILSEQRKISSVKRRGPGMKNSAQSETPVSKGSEPVVPISAREIAEENRIIAAIVAEDIKSLVESR